MFLVMLPFGWLLRPMWDSDAIYAAELAANVIGGLVAVAVSVAFLASVTLLPALVTLFKPRALLAPKPKEKPNAFNHKPT